jgi:hypothetical protein
VVPAGRRSCAPSAKVTTISAIRDYTMNDGVGLGRTWAVGTGGIEPPASSVSRKRSSH